MRLFGLYFFYDRHSFDVVSAESAVRMFKEGGGESGFDYFDDYEDVGGVAVGLTDRREYNGFVPLMDENDPLKTTVMRIFSGLQVIPQLLLLEQGGTCVLLSRDMVS